MSRRRQDKLLATARRVAAYTVDTAPLDTVWTPGDIPMSHPPGGRPPGVEWDILRAGDRIGGRYGMVPTGCHAIRTRDHDTTYVYVATGEHLLGLLDRLRNDLLTDERATPCG